MSVLENPWVATVLVVVVVGYVVLRRAVGEPLHARDLLVPPLVLGGLGVREVLRGDGLTSVQVLVVVVLGALAVALGGARAATVRLYLRDGTLWYRYRGLTYLTWLATALVGAAVRAGTHAAVDLPGSARTLYLSMGLTLAGESLVLALRGARTGARFAPEGRDAEATRRVVHEEMLARLRGATRR